MTTSTSTTTDWGRWLTRWEAQQDGYLPRRAERFEIMLDVIESITCRGDRQAPLRVLDLAAGPGSLSARILQRFDAAVCTAVDVDPVVLALGRATHGDGGGRLEWREANLLSADPAALVDDGVVDVAVSSTALHWLPADRLAALYARLGQAVRPGGVVINADNIPYRSGRPGLQWMAERLREHDAADALARGVDDWDGWWRGIAAEPGMEALIERRRDAFAGQNRDWPEPSLDFHTAALRHSGFGEIDTVWQHHDDRVLVGIR